MFNNTTGSNNIALGYLAGMNLNVGNNNIDIGNVGAAESNTIRIGTQSTQTATYIAGISGSGALGSDVIVSSSGKLGVPLSSSRFKRDIRDMGAASRGLVKLRPVTFRYKADPAGGLQYGLIAEEVERVYPELVTRGLDGKVETVRYSMLTSMLLNELQKQAVAQRKQARENERQAEQIGRLNAEVAATQRQLGTLRASFEERLSTLERATQAQKGTRNLAATFSR